MFDFFKSPQRKALKLVGTMYGVDASGMEPLTEAAEWVEDLSPDDPRIPHVPPPLLEGNYFLINRQRSSGVVFRITEEEVEVRLPFELQLSSGVSVPDSHLLRVLPVRALLALPSQRAQKVIGNAFQEATEVFQKHHRMCRVCFKRFAPPGYPGHPNEGVLGMPARRIITCESCLAAQESA